MYIIINNVKTLLRIVIYSIYNFIILVLSSILRRDKSIVLFGAWMGARFADNSRFLFQYLNMEKDKLSLKRIIWVSRNPEVVSKLSDMGYEAYLIGSKESTYWHLKSGIHIICNMSAKSGNYLPDIDVKLSSGAKKIQLWHGVGVKAVGATANSARNPRGKRSKWVTDFANLLFVRKVGSLGGWAEPKILCTSKLNAEINTHNSIIHKENAFISGYPRYCDCLKRTKEEQKLLDVISTYKTTILYLPTFRDGNSKYLHPLDSEHFRSYIIDNNILWIEKPHQADKEHSERYIHPNILYLNSDFDINVLLKDISIIISDYSSAAFDAIYLRKPVIMYVPDLSEFEKGGNGLLYDLREYCPSLLCFDTESLKNTISDSIHGKYFTNERVVTIDKIRTEFFGDKEYSYNEIWNDIISV